MTLVKKSLLKLSQQLTALNFTLANNLLLGLAQNLLKVHEQQFTIVL